MAYAGGKVQDTPENSFITIIDTNKLNKSFLKTTALIDQYNLTDDDLFPFDRPQHEQEYLAEWEVDLQAYPNSSTTVGYASLVEHGLTRVVPQLAKDYHERNKLQKSLQGFLSHVRTQRYARDIPLTALEIAAIPDLARCFPGRWKQIMHIWFMALARRSVDDENLKQIFKRGSNGNKEIFVGFRKAYIPSQTVVIEEQEFNKLMAMAAAYTTALWKEERTLPEWAPQKEVYEVVEEKKMNIPAPHLGFTSAAQLHLTELRQTITKPVFQSWDGISNEMNGRGF